MTPKVRLLMCLMRTAWKLYKAGQFVALKQYEEAMVEAITVVIVMWPLRSELGKLGEWITKKSIHWFRKVLPWKSRRSRKEDAPD